MGDDSPAGLDQDVSATQGVSRILFGEGTIWVIAAIWVISDGQVEQAPDGDRILGRQCGEDSCSSRRGT